MTTSTASTDQKSPEYLEFRDQLGSKSLAPLWEHLKSAVPLEPRATAVAHRWRFSEVRSELLHAGKLITAEEAERRVLVLQNPALKNRLQITDTMYAGMQLILPRERAPVHRHSQSALRFVMEGRGATTTVNGEPTNMEPGDFIITPPMGWHEHAGADEPVIWLDGLDLPLVNFLGAGFREDSHEELDIDPVANGRSRSIYSGLMGPLRGTPQLISPVFSYPYRVAREALHDLRTSEPDVARGIALRYCNPTTGGWAMPTIATSLHLFPSGYRGLFRRSTDGAIYVVTEGEITIDTPAGRLVAGAKDVVAVPGWTWCRLSTSSSAVAFSFSDQAAQEKLGLWRDQVSLSDPFGVDDLKAMR